MVRLQPNDYIKSITDISPDYFLARGIKGLILDLDNTITPWRAPVLDQEITDLFTKYREAGLRLCVVSNAFKNRVTNILGPVAVPGVARARKPKSKAFIKAMEIMGTVAEETAVIGDQIFTDILGGNRLGLYTILVVPLSKKEFLGTRVLRLVEKRLLRRLIRKGILTLPPSD